MRQISHIAVACAALLSAGAAQATPYSAFYVFGDSLSDRGNLAEVLGTSYFHSPPSFHYSFTNGPTAVSVAATSYGLTADPSLWLTNFTDKKSLFPTGYVPGTNYAVGDATANLSAPNGKGDINLPQQVHAFTGRVSGVADPNALYTIFIGGNDVKDATKAGGGGAAAIKVGVGDELGAITTLRAAGAVNFLVVNVPDVGGIPLFAQEDPADAAAATANTLLYNSELADGLKTFSGLNLTTFDLFTYEHDILANASRYGITNTTDPCYTKAPLSTETSAACGAGAVNIGSFAFWNDVHPTKQVHALIGQGIEQALNGVTAPAPTPEPGIWALLIMGFGLVGMTMRRSVRSAVGPRNGEAIG